VNFAKYQGTGNDFVMVNDAADELTLTPEIARSLCDRRFGVGADGVIRVAPGDEADFFMDYVNSDGSVSEICGNGIRCLAVFARAEGLTAKDEITVETGAGTRTVTVQADGRVRVDMGAPIFDPERVPFDGGGNDPLHSKIEVDGDVHEVAVLSMGNPHAVLFVEDPEAAPVSSLGPRLEHHRYFPNETNVEFVKVESPQRLVMRVWERGSRETMACGTGACAAAVAARLLRGTEEQVTVALRGGELTIEWSGSLTDEAPVLMTGPAAEVFRGQVALAV
jgi:diaminopimelate epimerase